ncbi:bifunctional diguanylate cyclase/phosphodiesterase [Solirubrobacter soli]|uniref:bifunctional diguanylate cyclase/phosphodiesterase n=1 Tax=Solirubrobacter soli TaxID=363832 RepID=UPI001FE1C66D|nr:EAL domain-containing protein [Solirubrobacter soli]
MQARMLSRRRVPLLAVFVGALASLAVSLVAFHADRARTAARDSEARAQAAGALEVLTAGLESRVVDVRSLFVSSESVSEREYTGFTTPMVGLGRASSINWLRKVMPADRAAVERELGVKITMLAPDGRLVADTTPGPVFPLRYGTRGVRARSLVGFNAFTSGDRRAAIERAVATGRPASTALIRLATGRRPGFVLYVPVYKPPGRHLMEDVVGVVAGAFSMEDARTAVLRAVPPGTGVRVRLEGDEVLDRGAVDPRAPTTSFSFAGRTWSVQSRAASGGGLRLGPVTLAAGILLMVLLLLANWARSSRRLLDTGRRDRDRAERRFLDTFASAPIGMALITPAGEIIRVNRAFSDLLGRPEDELAGGHAPSVILAEDRARGSELFIEAAARPGDAVAGDIRLHTAAGVRWTESHVTYLAGEGLLLIQAIDISDRREFEDQLVHQAEHDSLTDLLNRRGFRRVVARHLAGDTAGGAIMLLDLDHFKAVNDLHGHRAGDRVLEGAARVLRDCVRSEDAVARLGGDEFAVLLPHADAEQARAAAGRLLEALADHGTHGISASVGVAMLAVDMRGPDDALVAADLAMYDAKAAGRNRYAFFDEHATAPSATRDRLEWVERIRAALDEDRLVLAAQPIRCVRSGEVVHHELLLRMRDHDGREIPPGAFLGVAEEFGLIGEIDLWVARSAIAILDRHRDRNLVFHVNLSGRSLGEETLLASIRDELERTGVDPCSLVFEITETTAVSSLEEARVFAVALTEMGCRLALDDFGAGFSSFVYLKQLPFDVLKIDGEFVRQCTTTPADRVILESLVHTAAGLNKRTVAEFVEDQETEDLLRELGVDMVQGYHVGRPVAVDEAIAAVQTHQTSLM